MGITQLPAKLIERLGREIDQRIGIHLEPPIRRRADLISHLIAKAVNFTTINAEEKLSHGGRANIESCNKWEWGGQTIRVLRHNVCTERLVHVRHNNFGWQRERHAACEG